MKKPDLSKMVETFIQLPIPENSETDTLVRYWNLYVQKLRIEVSPLVSRLMDEGSIDWYCFLIHDVNSGVPTLADDRHLYIHLRFSLTEKANLDSIKLPPFCVLTRAMTSGVIYTIDKAALEKDDFAEAWRIIGEQSECILDLISIHKLGGPNPGQVAQFLHHFHNMTQLFPFGRNWIIGLRQ